MGSDTVYMQDVIETWDRDLNLHASISIHSDKIVTVVFNNNLKHSENLDVFQRFNII